MRAGVLVDLRWQFHAEGLAGFAEVADLQRFQRSPRDRPFLFSRFWRTGPRMSLVPLRGQWSSDSSRARRLGARLHAGIPRPPSPPSDTDQAAIEKAAQTCSRRDLEGWPAARCVVRIPGVGELNWLSTRRHRPYRVAGNENQLKIFDFQNHLRIAHFTRRYQQMGARLCITGFV